MLLVLLLLSDGLLVSAEAADARVPVSVQKASPYGQHLAISFLGLPHLLGLGRCRNHGGDLPALIVFLRQIYRVSAVDGQLAPREVVSDFARGFLQLFDALARLLAEDAK